MSKGIEDLLNEYSSDDEDSQASLALRNSTVDRLLDSDEDDDGGGGAAHTSVSGAKTGLRYNLDTEKGAQELLDRDLVEKLIASNDSDTDEEDRGSASDRGLSSSLVQSARISTDDDHSINTKGNCVVGKTHPTKAVIADEIKAALSTTRSKADTLDLAERNEARHLDGGNAQIRSPLRLTQQKRYDGQSSRLALKLEKIGQISTQLERNALYKGHGPGMACALHITNSHFFVGTSNGSILIFNSKYELVQVLGQTGSDKTAAQAGAGGSEHNPKKDAVAVIDVAVNLGIMGVAHASGLINLWHLSKGEVIYVVKDIHKSAVTFLKVVSPLKRERGTGAGASAEGGSMNDSSSSSGSANDGTDSLSSAAAATSATSFHTVSVDGKGQVYRGRYTKGLGFGLGVFNSYSAEFDCLLNGNAGVVTSACVSTPVRQWRASFGEDGGAARARDSGSSSSSAKGALDVLQFLAFNTATRSYVVLLQPYIHVLHKWPPTSRPSSQAQAQAQAQSALGAALSWSWSRQLPGSSKYPYLPVLLRGCGSSLETLTVDYSGGDGGGLGKAKLSSSFRFVASAAVPISTLLGEGGSGGSGGSGASEGGARESILLVQCTGRDRVVAVTRNKIIVTTHALRCLDSYDLHADIGRNLHASIATRGSMHGHADEPSAPSPPTSTSGTITSTWASFHSDSIYFLTPSSLAQVQVQSWVHAAELLVVQGMWLEALSLAMDVWEKQGGVPCPSAPAPALVEGAERGEPAAAFDDNNDDDSGGGGGGGGGGGEEEEEVRASELSSLAQLRRTVESFILRYVELSLGRSNVTAMATTTMGGATTGATTGPHHNHHSSSTSTDHHLLVSEVALDYCTSLGSLSLLFGKVYTLHQRAQLQLTFFDALEPYILSRRVTTLPSPILRDLVETFARNQRVSAMERCVLHLDYGTDDDVDFLSLFCLQRDLCSGYIATAAYGSADYSSTLIILFEKLLSDQRQAQTVGKGAGGAGVGAGVLSSEMVAACFKAILFVKFVCQGKAFPAASPLTSTSTTTRISASAPAAGGEAGAGRRAARKRGGGGVDVHKVCALITMLLSRELSPLDASWEARFPILFSHHSTLVAQRRRSSGGGGGGGGGDYAILELLLRVDAPATLEVISLGLSCISSSLSSSSSSSSSASSSSSSFSSQRSNTSSLLSSLHAQLFFYCSSRQPATNALSLYHHHNCEELAMSAQVVLPWALVRSLIEYLHAQHPPGSGTRFQGESLVCTLAHHHTPRGHLLTVAGQEEEGEEEVEDGDEGEGTAVRRDELRALLKKLCFWRAVLVVGDISPSDLPITPSASASNNDSNSDINRHATLLRSGMEFYLQPIFRQEYASSHVACDLLLAFLGDSFDAANDGGSEPGSGAGAGAGRVTVAMRGVLAQLLPSLGEVAGLPVVERAVCMHLLHSIPLVLEHTEGRVPLQLAALAAAVEAVTEEEDVDDSSNITITSSDGEKIGSSSSSVSTLRMPSAAPDAPASSSSSVQSSAPGAGATPSLRDCFSTETMTAYLRLLALHRPTELYTLFLSGVHAQCGVSEGLCLQLCKERNVLDATSLLLERGGDHHAACTLLVDAIGSSLSDAKREIEGDDRLLGVARGLLVSLDDSKSLAEAQSGLRSLECFTELGHFVDCAIGLCLRASLQAKAAQIQTQTPTPTQTQGVGQREREAQQLWFLLCGCMLQERIGLREPSTYSTSSELVGFLVVTQLQRVLLKMSTVMTTRDITRNIFGGGSTSNGSNSSNGNGGAGRGRMQLGDFKAIMLSMLRGAKKGFDSAEVMAAVSSKDLHSWRCKELSRRREGSRIDPRTQLFTHPAAVKAKLTRVHCVIRGELDLGPTAHDELDTVHAIRKTARLRNSLSTAEALMKRYNAG